MDKSHPFLKRVVTGISTENLNHLHDEDSYVVQT